MEIETVCAADMLPVRAHEADAGADLKAARDVAIRRGDTAKVSTGVRVSIPEGCFGLLAARSSRASKRRLSDEAPQLGGIHLDRAGGA